MPTNTIFQKNLSHSGAFVYSCRYGSSLLLAFILLGVFVSPALAQISQNCQSAQGGYCVELAQTYIPGLEFLKVPTNAEIGEFLTAVYYFLIGVVGLSAFIAFTVGGVMYLFSAGSEKMTSHGKLWMKNAAMGLAIAMISWLVLYTINPDLVTQLNLQIKPITGTIKGGGIGSWISATSVSSSECVSKLGPSWQSVHTSYCPQPPPQIPQDKLILCCVYAEPAASRPIPQDAKDCTKITIAECEGFKNCRVYAGACMSAVAEWVCYNPITGCSSMTPVTSVECAATCSFGSSCKKKSEC